MTDQVCYAYCSAFLQYLETSCGLAPASRVAIAGDLRSSTDRILRAACAATAHLGHVPFYCGKIPSPAVALAGLELGIPSIMITGSHIPDDRNGIKFNTPNGEILKADEEGIRAQSVQLPSVFDENGALTGEFEVGVPDETALILYRKRYLDFFPPTALKGCRIGLYGHSAVGREVLFDILSALGAEVVRLGFSDVFVAVDTEAIRPADVELAALWAVDGRFDAIVSTDGDSDRPLLSNEKGEWLRGDIAGILCAKHLGATTVVTPVSSNSAVELSGFFHQVLRTRIGSPYVIEQMQKASNLTNGPVVGYEANGGFLTASAIQRGERVLGALPTRDATIVLLSILCAARESEKTISEVVSALPPRFTASNRLQDFPTNVSSARVGQLARGGIEAAQKEFSLFGRVTALSTTDGVRMTFGSGEIVHVRPSGNAPELRCYAEADSQLRAVELAKEVLRVLEGLKLER